MKLQFATVLLCSLIVGSYFLEPAIAGPPSCDCKFAERCKIAGAQDRCLNSCGICSEECRCVSSGTYGCGNRHECPRCSLEVRVVQDGCLKYCGNCCEERNIGKEEPKKDDTETTASSTGNKPPKKDEEGKKNSPS